MADLLRGHGALLHQGRAALPGPRSPRRGSDRAAVQRPIPVSRGLARTADPAALRRPRQGGPAPVPRPVRDPARRGQHALQQVRALPELRRVPVPGARQIRRRGHLRPPRARAPERDAADRRRGGQTRDQPRGHGCHRRGGQRQRRTGDVPERHRGRLVRCGQQRQAAARLVRRTTHHPNGLANGSDQVGRNYMFHNSQAVLALSKEENPTVFQKTLGVNDFYLSGGDDFEFPLGNLQMVGKSQAPMFHGEKPGETRFAPNWSLEQVALHAVDFWLSTEDLPPPREPGHARPGRQRGRSPTRRATRKPSIACSESSRTCSRTSACTTTTCSPITPT